MDFEKANINAIKEIFPEARISACLFHFCQSIFRNVAEKGLKNQFVELNSQIRSTIQMLFGLPFVPISDVIDVFEIIVDLAPEATDELLKYVDNTYVRGKKNQGRRKAEAPRYPPEMWNVHEAVLNEEKRTNNQVEGWHNKFRHLVGSCHPSIWNFIEAIKTEQDSNEKLRVQILGGHSNIQATVSRKAVQMEKRLKTIVINYSNYKEEGKIPVFLKAISLCLKAQIDEAYDDEY